MWFGGFPPKSDLGDNSINSIRVDWVRTWELEDETNNKKHWVY